MLLLISNFLILDTGYIVGGPVAASGGGKRWRDFQAVVKVSSTTDTKRRTSGVKRLVR
jgi:hypothetical protein